MLIFAVVTAAAVLLRFSASPQPSPAVLPAGRKAVRPATTHPMECDALAALKSGDRAAFSQAFDRLAEIEPQAAARLLDQAGAFREDAIRGLARTWAKSDLTAARDWAVSLQEAGERERAVTFLSFALAEGDPGKALRFAQKEGLNDQTGTIRNLAQQWAARDFPAAREWAHDLPQGPERNEIFGRLAMVRATSDPVEAAQLVVSEIQEGPAQEEAAMTVLNRWLIQDPEAAAKWVESFPESDLKERADRELAGFWESGGGR